MKSLWTSSLREGRQEKDVVGDESIKSVGEQAPEITLPMAGPEKPWRRRAKEQ